MGKMRREGVEGGGMLRKGLVGRKRGEDKQG